MNFPWAAINITPQSNMQNTLKHKPHVSVQVPLKPDTVHLWCSSSLLWDIFTPFLFRKSLWKGDIMVRVPFKRQPHVLSNYPSSSVAKCKTLFREHSVQHGQGNWTKCVSPVFPWHRRLTLWLTLIKMWSSSHSLMSSTRPLLIQLCAYMQEVCLLVAGACVIVCFYANQVHMKFISWTKLWCRRMTEATG